MTQQTETVTVYTRPSCVQCTQTIRRLARAGIDPQVIDVTEDLAAYSHITETLGYRQAPVVEVGDRHWSGFRPDLIAGL